MKKERGFTIIELMITLVVAAILLAIAVPSFRSMIADNRLSGTATQVVASLNLARSEAIKRGASVQVASSSGTGDWKNGWSVNVGGTELRHVDAVGGDQTVAGTASSVQFNSRGELVGGGTLTIDVCDGRTGEKGRRVGVARTGRVQSEELSC